MICKNFAQEHACALSIAIERGGTSLIHLLIVGPR